MSDFPSRRQEPSLRCGVQIPRCQEAISESPHQHRCPPITPFATLTTKWLVADNDSSPVLVVQDGLKRADGKMEVAKGATDMTLRTIHRDRAGTTTFTAQAYYVVELDDPEAEGNGGLQGLDEESEYRENFPSRKAAEAWVRRQIKAHPDRLWRNGIIDEYQWEAEEYEWDGDAVLDAMSERTHSYDYWIADGKLRLEGDWRP